MATIHTIVIAPRFYKNGLYEHGLQDHKHLLGIYEIGLMFPLSGSSLSVCDVVNAAGIRIGEGQIARPFPMPPSYTKFSCFVSPNIIGWVSFSLYCVE